jgi:sulfopyruvate decarboxylase subunit beta
VRRIDCLAAIYDELCECAVVTIMGAVAAELYSLGHRPSFFYLEHAMGLASSLGLGVALVQPDRKVVVVDNESLLSVGGFPTATATGSDLAGIARAAGITHARTVRDLAAFADETRAALAANALSCIVAKVEATGPASFYMDLHPLENRFQFQRALRRPASPTPGERWSSL